MAARATAWADPSMWCSCMKMRRCFLIVCVYIVDWSGQKSSRGKFRKFCQALVASLNTAEWHCWRQTWRSSDIPDSQGCLLFVGCLTSQQQASVSQGRICSHNFTCCHTEIQVADQTFYLTQSQYTDTGPTSPSADPITPGAWQGSHWSANF